MDHNVLRIDSTQITADVYHENDKGVLYVKVTIKGLGMYINSFKVMESPKYPEKGLWVQWPSFKVGSKWIKPIEFANDNLFKQLVEEAVLRAVDLHNNERLVVQDIDEITDEELSRQLDEAIKELPP